MKKLFTLVTASLFAISSLAQCTSCTINVNGNDPADRVVGIGQVMCIQPGGNATGHILVTSGGRLCNQGQINSPNIFVSQGGSFDNYGTAHVDSLLVGGANSVLNNYGTITDDRIAATSGGVINNTGSITCDFLGDSTSTFTNNGDITVNLDFANVTGGNFINNRNLVIKRDFINTQAGTITTSCFITVQRDWYNAGTVNGPSTACGGFSITGTSLNSGTVGVTGHVDICDAGHPAFGVDANSGNLGSTTFCQCTNSCVPLGIDPVETKIAFSIFPNPAADKLQVRLAAETDGTVTMQNMLGETVLPAISIKEAQEVNLNTSALANGLYIITVETVIGKASRKVEIAR